MTKVIVDEVAVYGRESLPAICKDLRYLILSHQSATIQIMTRLNIHAH